MTTSRAVYRYGIRTQEKLGSVENWNRRYTKINWMHRLQKAPDGRYLCRDLFAGKHALPNKITFNKLELVGRKLVANCAHLECLFALQNSEANEVWDDIFSLKLNFIINFFNYILLVSFLKHNIYWIKLYYDRIFFHVF